MSSSRVENGATPGHSRIAAMFSFIESSKDNDGASMFEIQAYMLQEFDLDYDVTERYITKCAAIGFLKEQEGSWFITNLSKEISKNLDVTQF